MSSRERSIEAFERAADLHDLVVRRARVGDATDAIQVINLTLAVLMHGLLERAVLFATARYLSPELRRDLDAEHASLQDALTLMVELSEDGGHSEDLRALCAAVHERIARHAERDQRVLYGSLARLDAADPTEGF